MLQSTAALPFGTIVIILIIWGLVTMPLTIFGGIAGKNNKTDFAAPCRSVSQSVCVCLGCVCVCVLKAVAVGPSGLRRQLLLASSFFFFCTTGSHCHQLGSAVVNFVV